MVTTMIFLYFGLYLTAIATVMIAAVCSSIWALLASAVALAASAVFCWRDSVGKRDAVTGCLAITAGYCLALLTCILS